LLSRDRHFPEVRVGVRVIKTELKHRSGEPVLRTVVAAVKKVALYFISLLLYISGPSGLLVSKL
jgi:cytochrome b561